MTENELRNIMAQAPDALPDDGLLNSWSKATGLTKQRIREIFCEVIGDPTAFDPLGGEFNDGQP